MNKLCPIMTRPVTIESSESSTPELRLMEVECLEKGYAFWVKEGCIYVIKEN